MYPNDKDRSTYTIHSDSLLQAQGVVSEPEIHRPVHVNDKGDQCLIVVKHGRTTGTTIGYTNGLPSVKRTYPYREHGIEKEDSWEIAVVSDGKVPDQVFSDNGDSGSIVLTRDGHILGMLTGGAGPSPRTDISYVTPFWRILELINETYPNAHAYPIID